jgi:hypothetical protein
VTSDPVFGATFDDVMHERDWTTTVVRPTDGIPLSFPAAGVVVVDDWAIPAEAVWHPVAGEHAIRVTPARSGADVEVSRLRGFAAHVVRPFFPTKLIELVELFATLSADGWPPSLCWLIDDSPWLEGNLEPTRRIA